MIVRRKIGLFSRALAQDVLDGKVKGLAWRGSVELEKRLFGKPLVRKEVKK